MNKIADVVNYEGLYFIGVDYNVYSCRTHKIIKNQETNVGYFRVQLYKNGKSERISIHRIIAIALIPNPYNKPQINHVDNNRKNNHPSNLEWTTQSENLKHMHSQDRHKRSDAGESTRILAVKRKQGKLTYQQAEEIRSLKHLPQRKLAGMYGVSQFLIGRVLRYETYREEDFKDS